MKTATTTLLLALLVVPGCASKGTSRYTAAQADLGAIRNVAVLPFSTLTGDPSHAEKVQRIFLGELLSLGAVEVVEPGRVAQLGATERLGAPETLAPADLQRIGAALGVDGLFFGTVVDFGQGFSGGTPAPEVTLQLKLVEVASGQTAWQTTTGRSGPNARARLFGFGGDSVTEAARKLIREQLEALVK
ncbi:MAG: hypothetical protein F9K18_06705 [Thermoanaerobaculia bacterium]|nr:MAG: hypothetical protein F9K18_06705 [Thermoanaerobaculia bacterium]